MAKFIAIPVGQGDSFYFEREEFSALVDGGKSRHGFADLFKSSTGKDRVDVLVCTHNDADHANGVLGYLEAGMSCAEIWLPGRWLDALPQVLGSFDDLAREVLDSKDFSEYLTNGKLLEDYADQLSASEPANSESESESALGNKGWPESCIKLLEQAEPWDTEIGFGRTYRKFFYPYGFDWSPEKFSLFWSVIEAASRIRDIAVLAFHRGITVKWFEFDTKNPGGGSRFLLPINSREFAYVRAHGNSSTFKALALTVANKESRVFWAPPEKDRHPGILFTADSDLAGATLLGKIDLCDAIVTAPHHGSEANATAYSLKNLISSQVIWARSDGSYKN
jgi:hypothetical protein